MVERSPIQTSGANAGQSLPDLVKAADWREWYADPRVWPIGRHDFLADAALRLGRVIAKPWEDQFLSKAGDPLRPLPRGMVWIGTDRSPFEDGSGSKPVDADDDMAAGLWRPEGWTDEEEAALWDADVANHLRQAGRVAAAAIAAGIARMAATGTLTTYARSPAGDLEPIDRADWEIDDALGRLASCRLTPGRPSAPAAEGTHLVFVEREGLTKKLTAYARRHPIALNGFGALPTDRIVGDPTREERMVAICEAAMREHLSRDDTTTWSRKVLAEVVEGKTGRIFGADVLDLARSNLVKDFPHIAVGGRPKGG